MIKTLYYLFVKNFIIIFLLLKNNLIYFCLCREVEEFEWRTNLKKYERVNIVYQNKKLCDY